jgi:hypothetical protein
MKTKIIREFECILGIVGKPSMNRINLLKVIWRLLELRYGRC